MRDRNVPPPSWPTLGSSQAFGKHRKRGHRVRGDANRGRHTRRLGPPLRARELALAPRLREVAPLAVGPLLHAEFAELHAHHSHWIHATQLCLLGIGGGLEGLPVGRLLLGAGEAVVDHRTQSDVLDRFTDGIHGCLSVELEKLAGTTV
jgi:hypothetical protein